jgi:UrcA family protein
MPRCSNVKTGMQCALLVMLLGSLSAVAAKVGSRDEVPSRKVNFADLDITRSEGVAVLYARINFAAREVCSQLDSWVPELLVRAYQCREQAIARAVADVNAPALSSYHRAKAKPAIEPR